MKLFLALILLVAFSGCAMPVPTLPSPAEDEARRKANEAEMAARQQAYQTKVAEDKAKASQERVKFVEAHPGLPEEHKRAILSSELIVGLVLREVQAILGGILPRTESNGVGGKWSMWESVEGEDRYYLFFENDRLVRWDKKH